MFFYSGKWIISSSFDLNEKRFFKKWEEKNYLFPEDKNCTYSFIYSSKETRNIESKLEIEEMYLWNVTKHPFEIQNKDILEENCKKYNWKMIDFFETDQINKKLTSVRNLIQYFIHLDPLHIKSVILVDDLSRHFQFNTFQHVALYQYLNFDVLSSEKKLIQKYNKLILVGQICIGYDKISTITPFIPKEKSSEFSFLELKFKNFCNVVDNYYEELKSNEIDPKSFAKSVLSVPKYYIFSKALFWMNQNKQSFLDWMRCKLDSSEFVFYFSRYLEQLK